MTVGGLEAIPMPTRRLNLKWGIRLFAAISTMQGFWLAFNLDEYRPWHRRLIGAIVMTLFAHAGIWWATLEIRGRWRFLVALAMIPSIVSIVFLWPAFPIGVLILIGMSWLFIQVIRGKRLGS